MSDALPCPNGRVICMAGFRRRREQNAKPATPPVADKGDDLLAGIEAAIRNTRARERGEP